MCPYGLLPGRAPGVDRLGEAAATECLIIPERREQAGRMILAGIWIRTLDFRLNGDNRGEYRDSPATGKLLGYVGI